MPIKTTMSYHLPPVRIAIIKKNKGKWQVLMREKLSTSVEQREVLVVC